MTAAPAVLCFGLSAAASPTFTAYTQPTPLGNHCSGTPGTSISDVPVTASVSCAAPGVADSASATATYGSVGAAASAAGSANGLGEAHFNDTVRFSSASNGLVSVAMYLHLSGSFAVGIPNAGDVEQATTTARLYFAGLGPFAIQLTDDKGVLSSGSSGFTIISGDPNSTIIDLVLLSPSIMVPLNQDIDFTFYLQATALTFGPTATASASFSNTFGFVSGSDAFLLPEGVTANAGTYLVNNRFLNGSHENPDPPVDAVPEPASWSLMLFGFGLLGWVKRRRSLLSL
ncbi:PEPxxWA-CTERM sorting domain-containing protein [Govanella unica]|uniref:PEPxxWA-CTERM sorting domain-containing protein n=1 Tax=Govanella unica TaxID=2975056 RepID=A0A9X3Z672_9PROT|nr:PEPxxWA-CTERM sorting domain-containing protein [Govania unica]MDA5192826.1 PEPxxWA-CTERM sorting domain-containing protein [Govania unica]